MNIFALNGEGTTDARNKFFQLLVVLNFSR